VQKIAPVEADSRMTKGKHGEEARRLSVEEVTEALDVLAPMNVLRKNLPNHGPLDSRAFIGVSTITLKSGLAG
jgi:hypothetical protein